MAARTLGWAQRTTTGSLGNNAINAILGTSINPFDDSTPASDQAFEVTAGTSVSIRWGGRLRGADYGDLNTNTITWTLNVYYETASSTLWETAATDTFSQVGTTGASWALDRTLTFTPTHTGTVRMVVRARVFVTATSTTVADINSDGGNFGAPAETLPVGQSSVRFVPGLVRCGTSLNSLTISGLSAASQGYYPDVASLAFVTGHAPRVADGTYTVSLRRGDTDAQVDSKTIAAGTVTSLPAVTDTIDNSYPLAQTPVNIRLTPANSALSTALGGSGLPWVHFTSVPSTPGTVTHNTTTQVVTFTSAFNADPRIILPLHAENDSVLTSGADKTAYVISADQGFMWVANATVSKGAQNAGGTALSGLTVLQELLANDAVTVLTSGSSSTNANGITSVLDFTTFIAAPSGNRTQKATVTAPSNATGNSNSRLLGFASAYTADRAWAVQVADEVAVGELTTIVAQYRDRNGSLDQDSPPSIRVYRIDSTTGAEVDDLAATTATTLAQNDAYKVTWTPTTEGVWMVEVRGFVSGGAIEACETVTVRPRTASLALNDLTDVDTTGVVSGDVLYFDGSGWRDEHMPTAAEVANAVWDETTAESRPTGSYGKLVRDSLPVPAVDPAAIVNATWDELTSESRTAGSYGQLLKDSLPVDLDANLHSDIQ